MYFIFYPYMIGVFLYMMIIVNNVYYINFILYLLLLIFLRDKELHPILHMLILFGMIR